MSGRGAGAEAGRDSRTRDPRAARRPCRGCSPRGGSEATASAGARKGVPAAGAWSVPSLLLALVLAAATSACDDQVKYVETFATMVDGAAEQTYERKPLAPVDGTVPVSGVTERYTVLQADTALSNPLQRTSAVIERGRQGYENFCLPCHGSEGRGDGPVINTSGQYPGRFPPLPTADLTAQRAREFSDGYIWGVIGNGIRLMPSYGRIPPEERWYIVEYVRFLQEAAAGSGGGIAAGPSGSDAAAGSR